MLVTLYCPCPTKGAARRLARALLARRLIACANLFPVEAHYRWKGRMVRASETVLLAKTQRQHIRAVTAALAKLHPYELPGTEFFPVLAEAKFGKWVHAETERPRGAFKGSRGR